MPTTGGSPASDGMYSQLIDDEANYDEQSHKPDVGRSVSSVKVNPTLSGPGRYRLATICLAALCVILLISIIAVAAHNKNKTPQGSGETAPEIQKQTQDTNVTALMATITKLQQEKKQLQKERDELQNKLAMKTTTKVPEVVRPTSKAAVAPIVCPQNWRLFNNSCYLISTNTLGWSASQSYCQSKGAHLAIILTAEEQTFLWNLLPRGHWNSYWFGITDGQTEDVWKWVDGTQVVGGFWEVGEPNNHINEDCGYIVKTQVLERVAIRSWYDAPCSMSLPFICEKEM
ncbi:CD209 antigen-like protein C isoform X2 [Mugil cephalus]|uniref:CD209 antigen-like protein C isoform X2 n=1 Tax=Mugil cephalus TaxID=48193 RepID=UPI001FB7E04E|nr:CD209 antigen-like protein C isoform X2 [Mugil cephalus]